MTQMGRAMLIQTGSEALRHGIRHVGRRLDSIEQQQAQVPGGQTNMGGHAAIDKATPKQVEELENKTRRGQFPYASSGTSEAVPPARRVGLAPKPSILLRRTRT